MPDRGDSVGQHREGHERTGGNIRQGISDRDRRGNERKISDRIGQDGSGTGKRQYTEPWRIGQDRT
jgi:hypothetical protein